MSGNERFEEEALLAYAQGAAGAELRARIEAAMAEDEALRAEVALMRGLKPALAGADAGNAPGEFGWKRLEAEIRRETAAAAPPARFGGAALWRVAAMLLLCVALGQAGWIVSQRQDAAGGLRTATDPGAHAPALAPAAVHVLGVAFAADAPSGAVSALLRAHRGRIVDGPGAVGLYRVAFRTEAARASARAAFESSALVELVAEE